MLRSLRRGGGLGVRRWMSSSAESLEQRYIVPTYAKGGVRAMEGLVFESGKGCELVDEHGKRYIDFGAGIAVTVLGHADEEWAAAVKDQMDKVAHTSNLYHTRPYLELAEMLIENSPGMSKVFFCNSGTEATEGAIKFARVYQNAQGQGSTRNRFIAFTQSFHGRSLGGLSLTYKPAIRVPFQPMLMPNVDHLPFNSIEALEQSIGPDVIAMILEPVQGEGGVTPASREFVKRARELCDEHGVMLIFDEVQIGLGRQGNGKLWGYQELGVVPDLLTMAKPLANGLPIGGVMLGEKMYSKVPESAWLGTHGSTFASNPLVTRAATVVVKRLTSPGFLDQVKENGAYMISRLDQMKEKLGPQKITQVRRPLGDAALYAGIQLPTAQAGAVVSHCLKNGVVVLTAGDYGTVIRLCPPLTISKEQITKAMDVLEQAIDQVVQGAAPSATTTDDDDHDTAKFILETGTHQGLASASAQEYQDKLVQQGHTVLPKGFKVGVSKFSFFPAEIPRTEKSKPYHMNLNMIVPDAPTNSYAAMFTRNLFPGAPVKVGRELLKSKAPIGAVVINNRISNVHPRGGGVEDAKKICEETKKVLQLDQECAVFPSSTGIIGWRLPVSEFIQAIPDTASKLNKDSIMSIAKGIMTTDTYPKARSCVIRDKQGNELGRVTGIAKGAGMIEPNMATMLVYILTDIDAEAATLQSVLETAVNADGSFNRISVDSDQSTSDTILLLSSKAMPKLDPKIEHQALLNAVQQVCQNLAEDVVRNGEGTQHVFKVNVHGAPSKEIAHGVGKAIVNSPLVKTGIAGNDPNVGRLISSIGDYLGQANPAWGEIVSKNCTIYLGDQLVFENGEFCIDAQKETALQHYLKKTELPAGHIEYPAHYDTVDITVYMRGEKKSGGFSTTVFGADLTHTYVDVNAGYRS